jgi:nucleoside-diphosphate-sugar epimerase
MKRVLLTGARGFIGSQASPLLLEAGFDVHTAGRRAVDLPGVTHHSCDLLNSPSVDGLLQQVKPSHLLHLAWNVKHGEYWTSPENAHWVESSIALLRAFAANGGERCVTAGTCAEYEWAEGTYQEESTPCRPATVYGASKHALQLVQSSFCRTSGISSAWGRIFHLYGPFETPQRLVPSVILALLRDEAAVVRAGNLVRDFLHVTDVARAFVMILESDLIGPINIGSGVAIEQGAVARVVAEIVGRPDRLEVQSLSNNTEPAVLVPDSTRLRSIGFRPQLTLENGLAQTISWWRAQKP